MVNENEAPAHCEIAKISFAKITFQSGGVGHELVMTILTLRHWRMHVHHDPDTTTLAHARTSSTILSRRRWRIRVHSLPSQLQFIFIEPAPAIRRSPLSKHQHSPATAFRCNDLTELTWLVEAHVRVLVGQFGWLALTPLRTNYCESGHSNLSRHCHCVAARGVCRIKCHIIWAHRCHGNDAKVQLGRHHLASPKR